MGNNTSLRDCTENGGLYSVYRVNHSGEKHLIEADLLRQIATDMVADYAPEGVECVMEQQRTQTPRGVGSD